MDVFFSPRQFKLAGHHGDDQGRTARAHDPGADGDRSAAVGVRNDVTVADREERY